MRETRSRPSGSSSSQSEVALDRSRDADLGERAAGEDRLRVLGRQVEDAGGERLGDDGAVGVLKEERVVADRGPVGLAQEPVPQAPLDRDLGVVAQALPERLEGGAGAGPGEALAAELAAHAQRLGRDVVTVGKRRLEPGEESVGRSRVGLVSADRDELAVAPLEGEEGRPVGGEAEIATAGPLLALGQIVGQAGLDVGPFPAQIALELDDRGAEQHVGPAADFGQADLVLDRGGVGAEGLPQQLLQQDPQPLVAGAAGEVADEVGKALAAPALVHARTMLRPFSFRNRC